MYFSLVNRTERVECAFTEVSWVVKSAILIQSSDGLHFFRGKIKVKQRDVFYQTFLFYRFWDNCGASLHTPPENNLRWGFSVFGRDFFDHLLFETSV